MALENDENRKKNKKAADLKKAAALGGAVLSGTIMGADIATRGTLDRINAHMLSPAAIHQVRVETGASSSEIVELEARLKAILAEELNRIRTNSRH
jgi:hypothetical protein